MKNYNEIAKPFKGDKYIYYLMAYQLAQSGANDYIKIGLIN
jgi:hypothetical protein